MTTDTDIVNRALQILGTRTTVASLAEQSNEAIQANIAYGSVRDWCFGLANWDFAKATATLSAAKSVTPPVGTWTNASPSPPWLFECSLPSDFIKAVFVTNSAHYTTNNWNGEPQRFAMGINSAGTAQILLTNATPAILVYVKRITDPTLWPWYFERLVVMALAWTLCAALTGEKATVKYLHEIMMQHFAIASQINTEQALIFNDDTPEWISALGIPYPTNRQDNRVVRMPPRQQRKQASDDDS